MTWPVVIDCFASGTYTVTRSVEGTYVAGRLVPDPAPTTIQVQASIQPMSGYDLQNLPEGHHANNVRKVFTTTELKARQDGFAPDRFDIDGEAWEVQTVMRWEDGTETHYEAMISRLVKP